MKEVLAFFIALVSYAGTGHGKTFEMDGCVRMDVDGTIRIDGFKEGRKEASITFDLAAFPSNVIGSCTKGGSSQSMDVHFNWFDRLMDWIIVFTTKDGCALMDQMIKFVPSNVFMNRSLPAEMVALTDVGSTWLSLTNASFVCKVQQCIPFNSAIRGAYNFTVTQVISNLHVQAFNLKGGTFSPAEECGADQTTAVPTTLTTELTTSEVSPASLQTSQTETTPMETTPMETTPTETTPTETTPTETTPTETTTVTTESTAAPTTTSTPVENIYVVYNQFQNVTCIVMRADIAFSCIVYDVVGGGRARSGAIPIPVMNGIDSVKVSGSCSMPDGTQQMVITFYKDWTLTLTFARHPDYRLDDKFTLQDIQFDYVLTPEFFPNASAPGTKRAGQAQGLIDFMKGSVNGGSYKCDSKLTTKLDNGAHMETTDLQYKAFNADNDTTFGHEVSVCSADEGLERMVPLYVVLALVGIAIIMVIIFLISRHRHQQQRGYVSL